MKADNIFIDTHCHLDDPRLYQRRSEIIATAGNCGVDGFIVPGVSPENWDRIISLSREDTGIFAAPGAHPMHADKWTLETSEILQKLTLKIIAIGEIGLDYSPGMPSHELQQEIFRAQLRIARDGALPVIIHCRKAFADTLKILKEQNAGEFGGVMHAFSGSLETARECVSMGLKIGIAGTVTWSNAIRPLTILKAIPLQHLLLETDSPDLSPEPHRGETNEPAFLINIATKAADLKGVSIEELAAATTENARAVFRGIRNKI